MKFKSLFDRLEIKYDDYVRTTEERHIVAVKEFWKVLYENGFIYLDKHEGWYSTTDEAFVPDNQIKLKDGKSIFIMWCFQLLLEYGSSGNELEFISEDNYKFKLSSFQV